MAESRQSGVVLSAGEAIQRLGSQEAGVALMHDEVDALLSLLEQAINAGMTPGIGLHVEAAERAGFKIVSERWRDQDPYNRAPRIVGVVFRAATGTAL